MENTLKWAGQGLNRGWMLAAGVLLASSARADVRYTQETRMADEQNAANSTSLITRSVSPVGERTDVTSIFGEIRIDQTTIRLCEKNQEIQLNSGLKIYTLKPLNETKPAQPADHTANTERDKNEKGTGKIVTNYIVKDLGEEMVANFKTHHYMVTTELKFSGCIGDNTMESKVEVWVSDVKEASPCAQKSDPTDAYASLSQDNCKLSFEQKGDIAAYAKAFDGILMRQKIYDGDKVLMVQEVTSFSQAKLGEELFAVPAGYKQVTPEQLQTQQATEMMNAMMAGDASADEYTN